MQELILQDQATVMEERISICIWDQDSRISLIEIEMTLKEFALCITGRGDSTGEVVSLMNGEHFDKLGKIKKTEWVECRRVSYDKDKQREEVLADLEKYTPMGYYLHSDGCSTKQSGDNHKYVICKYLTPEEYKKEQEEFVL